MAADQRRNLSRNLSRNLDAESVISAISGEAFVSLRSRRSCAPGRTPHKLDVLAKNLKDYHNQTELGQDSTSCCDHRQPDTKPRFNGCFHGYRFVIAIMAGTSVGMMLFHRYSMAIAVLSMVNQTHLYLEEHPNKTYQDFLDEGYLPGGEFLWNNEVSKHDT
jgi:hypothetical protein